ncbi:MAG: hypothetical protein ABIS01_13810, partial [Ferruginibacter sp.]
KKLALYIDQHFPAKFSTYQLAWFLYGEHRGYQASLIDLLKRDIIDTMGDGYKLTRIPFDDFQKEENPMLPVLPKNIAAGNTFTYEQGMAFIDNDKVNHPSFKQLASLSKKVDYQKFVVPGFVLAIGFARLFQGMANEKPVGFLVSEIGIFSVIALMIAAQYSYTYQVFKKSEDIWNRQNNNGLGNDILNNFTILGVAAIAGFAEYNTLLPIFEAAAPTRRSSPGVPFGSDSGGCSGGGDSGCGGGGCGGCGGGD